MPYMATMVLSRFGSYRQTETDGVVCLPNANIDTASEDWQIGQDVYGHL